MELENRHVLIVGATGGLGSQLARALAARGAVLTLTGRDEDRLTALAAEVSPSVRGTVLADLTDPDTPARVAESGPYDVVVLAAGVVAFGALTDLDDDDLDQLFLVNVIGPARLLRAVIPGLQPGSAIVSLSAVVAEAPTAGMAAYSASKAALTALDKAVAVELRRQKIRIVDVRPPHTETGLAGRPLAGEAPRLRKGKDPAAVAERIVQALVDDETELASTAF